MLSVTKVMLAKMKFLHNEVFDTQSVNKANACKNEIFA